MTKAFVDTTILADALLKKGPLGDTARAALQRFAETELPVYAIKELRAGILSYYVWLHNKFATEKLYSRVLAAIHAVARRQTGRTATALEALSGLASSIEPQDLDALQRKYGGQATLDVLQAEEHRLALKAIILKAWRHRRSLTTRVVCPLTCFAEPPPIEKRGLIELGPLGCTLSPTCCMRDPLVAKRGDLEKLRDVAKQEKSREHQKRYQALRALHRTPNRPLSRDACRDLGDAVFAFFCPPDAVILTTNIKDHEPLAKAVGKAATRP